jgi:hypothetical protein
LDEDQNLVRKSLEKEIGLTENLSKDLVEYQSNSTFKVKGDIKAKVTKTPK